MENYEVYVTNSNVRSMISIECDLVEIGDGVVIFIKNSIPVLIVPNTSTVFKVNK